MSGLEYQEFVTRMNAMSTEEKTLAISLFPSEILLGELVRRDNEQRNMIGNIRTILGTTS